MTVSEIADKLETTSQNITHRISNAMQEANAKVAHLLDRFAI